MAFVKENFGSQILGGSAESVRACLAVLGETEVRQPQVSLFVDQNILWLQIAVDDIEGV